MPVLQRDDGHNKRGLLTHFIHTGDGSIQLLKARVASGSSARAPLCRFPLGAQSLVRVTAQRVVNGHHLLALARLVARTLEKSAGGASAKNQREDEEKKEEEEKKNRRGKEERKTS